MLKDENEMEDRPSRGQPAMKPKLAHAIGALGILVSGVVVERVEAQVPVPRGPRVVTARPMPSRAAAQPAARARALPAPRVYIGGNTNPANLAGNSVFIPLPGNASGPAFAPIDNQLPSYGAGYYGTYGFPNTYYLPTYQSYAAYAAPGSVASGGGYPVPSVTYSTPGSPALMQGGASGASGPGYSYAGYQGYNNPTAYYGAPNMTSVSVPGYVTYGQNSHAALTPPGYYGNYVVTQPTTTP
jgi:hypothetical protein